LPDRPGVTYDQAFDEATAVMAEMFGQVQRRDRRGGVVECRPTQYIPSRLEYSPQRLPLSAAQSRYRRVASLKLYRQHGVVQAGIRVEIQREDTREHREFARHRDPYDTVVQTPVDEEGGGGVLETVWNFVRFDDRAEREALTELVDRLAEKQSLPATQPAKGG
jgi:hypothetical protein